MSDAAERPVFEYLLTGRTARGRTVTEIVEAPSADEAVRRFEDQGHTEVVLHTDDVVALFQEPSQLWPFSPRQLAASAKRGPVWQTLVWAANGYWLFWTLTLPAFAWLVYRVFAWLVVRRADGLPWDLWDLLPAGVLLLPVLVALLMAPLPAMRADRDVYRAIGWARWDEVLRLERHFSLLVPPVECSLRKAQALAGPGRLDEGLAELEKCRDLVPEYLFWAFQSEVYAAARLPERELEALARAHAAAPTNVNVLIGYAAQLLYLHRDVRRARELLAEARRHAVSENLLPLLLAAEAMADLEEGRPADAVGGLTEAIRQMSPFARGNPIAVSDVAKMRAYLSLAHAALGDTAAARREFARARPLLVAHGMDNLLRRCEEAVG